MEVTAALEKVHNSAITKHHTLSNYYPAHNPSTWRGEKTTKGGISTINSTKYCADKIACCLPHTQSPIIAKLEGGCRLRGGQILTASRDSEDKALRTQKAVH